MGLLLKLELLKNKVFRKLAEKKAEKQVIKNIKNQAKMEAMEEMKPQLKEKYKQDMVDKMSGKDRELKKQKAKEFFGKIAKDFKESNIGSRDSVDYMLGKGGSGVDEGIPNKILGSGNASGNTNGLPSQDRIMNLMGGRQQQVQQQVQQPYYEKDTYYEEEEGYRAPKRRLPKRRASAIRVPKRRAPERRAPARRAPERRAPARRAPARRAPARRAPARRAPTQQGGLPSQEKLARLVGGNNGNDSKERIMRVLGRK